MQKSKGNAISPPVAVRLGFPAVLRTRRMLSACGGFGMTNHCNMLLIIALRLPKKSAGPDQAIDEKFSCFRRIALRIIVMSVTLRA